MPFDIPYGVSIGLDRAKQVMAAAEAEAKKRNWKMNIAVVDTNGELVHFSRMEGAQIASGPHLDRQGPHCGAPPANPAVFYNAFETGHGYVATLDPDPGRLPPAVSRWLKAASLSARSVAVAAPAIRTPQSARSVPRS